MYVYTVIVSLACDSFYRTHTTKPVCVHTHTVCVTAVQVPCARQRVVYIWALLGANPYLHSLPKCISPQSEDVPGSLDLAFFEGHVMDLHLECHPTSPAACMSYNGTPFQGVPPWPYVGLSPCLKLETQSLYLILFCPVSPFAGRRGKPHLATELPLFLAAWSIGALD